MLLEEGPQGARRVAGILAEHVRIAGSETGSANKLYVGTAESGVRRYLSGTDAETELRARGILAAVGGADLSNASLEGADLQGADLRGALLSGVEFLNANLRDAGLRTADLDLADLGEADLRNADLRAAELLMANLRSARLTPVGGLSQIRQISLECGRQSSAEVADQGRVRGGPEDYSNAANTSGWLHADPRTGWIHMGPSGTATAAPAVPVKGIEGPHVRTS